MILDEKTYNELGLRVSDDRTITGFAPVDKNPILDLVLSNDFVWQKLSGDKLAVFREHYVEPAKELVRRTVADRGPSSPQDPSSRDVLAHLMDNHLAAHTPLGDLAFCRQEETYLLHLPILNQAYEFLTIKSQLGHACLHPERINTVSWRSEMHFIGMALAYEVLPIVGSYLRDEKNAEEMTGDVAAILKQFQKKIRPLSSVSLNEMAATQLPLMIFAKTQCIDEFGNKVYPAYNYGTDNNGAVIRPLSLIEDAFFTHINRTILTSKAIPWDTDVYRDRWLKYGQKQGDNNSDAAKVELFVRGVEITKILRDWLQTQYQLRYGRHDNPQFARDIASLSDATMGHAAFLRHLER